MQILIDELRLGDLKKVFMKTGSYKLHEFVKAFKETALDALDVIALAPDGTSLNDLKSAAHRLRGASLNIGAPALAEMAAKIENGAKTGNLKTLALDKVYVQDLYAATLSELSSVLRQIH